MIHDAGWGRTHGEEEKELAVPDISQRPRLVNEQQGQDGEAGEEEEDDG